jgi:hypothetical protein
MKDHPKIGYYLKASPHFDFEEVAVLQRPETPNQFCPLFDTLIVKKEDARYFIDLLNEYSLKGTFSIAAHPGFVSDERFGEIPFIKGYDHKAAFNTLINTLETTTHKGLDNAIA